MTKKEKTIEECKGCRFVLAKNREYLPLTMGADQPKNYYCRRYPPVEVGIQQVSPAGWCGEFKFKPEKKIK